MVRKPLSLVLIFVALLAISIPSVANEDQTNSLPSCFTLAPYAFNPPTQEQVDSGEILFSTEPFPCESD